MFSCEDNISYWLAAARLRGIGLVKLQRWLNKFPDIKHLFTASHAELQAAALNSKEIDAIKTPDWQGVERDLAWRKQADCHIIAITDAAYPKLLQEISSPPLVLFVQGNPEVLTTPQLAIVGTRNPTITGRESAQQFAYCLAETGLTITSGLALGIDAASHEGTLAANKPTIAVTGAGLNYIYPASHKKLAHKIREQCAIVSEFAPDMPPIAKNFPRRNRIISGLSLGVLVIEAALHSGSLITARFAAEQGREVFALPGSIHNPLSRGCHHLIQQGAKLIEKAADVIEELGMLNEVIKHPSLDQKSTVLGQKQLHLLTQIGYEATPLDTIIKRSGLTVAEVSSMLLALELRGSVHTVSGGYALAALSNG